jgi:hypothetical protein
VAFEREWHSYYQGNSMIDAIRAITTLANKFRLQVLSVPVIYRTKAGKEYAIYASPWAESEFRGIRNVGFDNVNLNQFRSAFTVLKDQLIFDGEFHEPKVGDFIIEKDGKVSEVCGNMGLPQWYYADDNPSRNTIIINCRDVTEYGKQRIH